MRLPDLTARFRYTTEMLKAIEPLIDAYVEEGGELARLIGFIEAKFSARDSEITTQIASARDELGV